MFFVGAQGGEFRFKQIFFFVGRGYRNVESDSNKSFFSMGIGWVRGWVERGQESDSNECLYGEYGEGELDSKLNFRGGRDFKMISHSYSCVI